MIFSRKPSAKNNHKINTGTSYALTNTIGNNNLSLYDS